MEELDLRGGEEDIVSIEERITHGIAELVESLRRETPKVDDPAKNLEEMRRLSLLMRVCW